MNNLSLSSKSMMIKGRTLNNNSRFEAAIRVDISRKFSLSAVFIALRRHEKRATFSHRVLAGGWNCSTWLLWPIGSKIEFVFPWTGNFVLSPSALLVNHLAGSPFGNYFTFIRPNRGFAIYSLVYTQKTAGSSEKEYKIRKVIKQRNKKEKNRKTLFS